MATTEDSASIRIVARTNGVGIDRDVRILADAMADWGARPTVSHHRAISPLRRLFDPAAPDDCVVFLERIKTRWLRRARRVVLIPNQERYPERQVGLLRRADHVLVKSRHAQEIFSRHHPSVRYVGFTSVDRRLDDVAPDYARFFHLAGGSSLKGTATLLEVWARHPEWPLLTVLYHRDDPLGDVPRNVRVMREYVSDAELQLLQNSSGVHLCPSRSEGWGHYIVEAMSCAAVVVTTDGPPMNEIVQPDRGVLVPCTRTEPRKLGINYYVDPAALEAAIAALLEQPDGEKARLGRAARAWFEANDRAFGERLAEELGAILS